jgi:hypothetical protein
MARRVIGLAPWRPTKKGRAVANIANDMESEWPLLVRRVLYVAYETGLYPDKGKGSYDSVGNFLGRARRGGWLPWEAVADVTDRVEPLTYDGPDHFARTVLRMADSCRLDRQQGQPHHTIVWSEHRGLVPVLEPVASGYGVPIIASGGFDSTSTRYAEALASAGREVRTVVLHFGDLDDEGRRITDLLKRDLPALHRDLTSGGTVGQPGRPAAPEVVRVAVTAAQARNTYPGWNGGPIQVDALPTPLLREILRAAIEHPGFDRDTYQQVLERERTERQQVIAWADAAATDARWAR